MNPLINSYSFSLERSSKKNKQRSSSQLPSLNNFFFYNTISSKHHNHTNHNQSLPKKTKSFRYLNVSTQPSLNTTRKDIYGNKIEKGGNYKISFKDDIKGKQLVETTMVDLKKNVIKNKKVSTKFNKNDFIIREIKNKEDIVCSCACNIF